ncbi:hypothetical protein D3C74_458200 [compost metagenome]
MREVDYGHWGFGNHLHASRYCYRQRVLGVKGLLKCIKLCPAGQHHDGGQSGVGDVEHAGQRGARAQQSSVTVAQREAMSEPGVRQVGDPPVG